MPKQRVAVYFDELLDAAGKMTLNEADAKRITDLCVRIGKRNMRRNHIVHGHWTCHITPTETGQTEEWIRVYDNVNPSLGGSDPKDPKLLGFYNFTIPALDTATDHVEEMVQALLALLADTPKLLARQQTREERFRSWVAGRQEPNGGVALRLSQCRYP